MSLSARADAVGLVANELHELGLSPKAVSAALLLIGLALLPLADWSSQRLDLLFLILLLDSWALVIWLLTERQPLFGRWLAVVVATALLIVAASWLAQPELLMLGVAPIVLAMALLGFPAALITALSQGILWSSLALNGAAGFAAVDVAVGLVAQGLVVSLLFTLHRPMQQITAWSWQHFRRAQTLLEEARNRQAELAQTLDDLAHANRQLTLLNEKLAGLRLLAEEAQQAKAHFVAKVSHELRAPLNIIISLIDLLMETPEVYGDRLPPLLLEDLQIVHRNCEHLAHLISDVLDLSQAEAGHLALRRTWVDLAEMMVGAVEQVRPLALKKKLQLRLDLPSALPAVYCDPNRTRQVILNLVSNAVRFTERGQISLQVEQEERHFVVQVNDTGAGIAPEHAERIFEAFYQGSDGAKATQGYGLGLSISKQFVELQGGKMGFTSQLGVGSTFYFTLPLAPPEAPQGKPGHWIREEWLWRARPVRPDLPQHLLRPRVLIWDTLGDLAPFLAHYLEDVEFIDTRSLSELGAALAACPAHAVLINASHGHEELIDQARGAAPDTPILACAVQSPRRQALAAGATNYLIKPVLGGELKAAVQALQRPLPRVLVVDDDPDFQQLLPRILQTCAGVGQVQVATCGAEALTILRSAPPDLLLLDVVLPDLSGWQILEIKNCDPTLRSVPTIILSAQDPSDEPVTSKFLWATCGQGLSVNRLVHCSLAVALMLQQPEPAPA